MHNTFVRGAAALSLTVGLLGVSAASASATTSTVKASGTGKMTLAGLPVASTSFAASKTGSDVSGSFTGSVESLKEATITGPITCLDVVGDTVSFVYPVATAGGLPAADATAIEFTIKKGTDGAASKANFLGPLPAALLKSCAPLSVTPFTYTGTLSIRS